jgi:bifunctional DNA-binding transcriptional regulator/antitoxin component of YhaV-PrlF toxin-antitoxin module
MQRELETTLTEDHRVNLPAELLQKLGWQPGDRLTVSTYANDTVVVMRRAKSGWNGKAGQMGDVWGDHEDNMRYLDEERASWDESVLASAPDGNR